MDAIDEGEWEREWASMEVRSVPDLQRARALDIFKIDLGPLLSATISRVPTQFVDRLYFSDDDCAICSESTLGMDRSAACLSVRFQRIENLAAGIWVHKTCFERLPPTDVRPPIPW